MISNIKYRYAINDDNELVDVSNLNRNELNGQKFYSIDFHSELIPKLGDKVSKHFAHKGDSEGNNESYLHALGKKVFADGYQKCLDDKTPFILTYIVEHKCTRLSSLGLFCSKKEQKTFDLTTRFDTIFVEKRDGMFIPDVMLYDSKHGDKIYIEIAVTHFCEPEKINSGNRIIEFSIQKESDIKNIVNFKEGKRIDNEINYYNFKTLHEYSCVDNCDSLFSVTKINNQNVDFNRVKGSDINPNELTSDSINIISKTSSIIEEVDDLLQHLKLIKNKGVNVVNCLNCINYNLDFGYCQKNIEKRFDNINSLNVNSYKCDDYQKI